ncbi:DNA mismatch repair protein MutT [Streptomyces sp. AS58]|uniref:NUDIX domain-containing protein n=1 Tax=Streptomyces sp. AS58 TaxID=1519489 RepID=UPI0006ADDAEC|nr:NUDIX domain-containing protein [Streptomyces sp. AS58]KOV49387.1 DNA mismatch repair protein MutT [Streptomyces sp. AS58]
MRSRSGTPAAIGYGRWRMPSGRLDRGETLPARAVRELHEETGITVDPTDLRLAYVVHHRQDGEVERIDFFFEAEEWEGEPVNQESDRYMALTWFTVHELPHDIIEYPREGLLGYLNSTGPLAAHNWQ